MGLDWDLEACQFRKQFLTTTVCLIDLFLNSEATVLVWTGIPEVGYLQATGFFMLKQFFLTDKQRGAWRPGPASPGNTGRVAGAGTGLPAQAGSLVEVVTHRWSAAGPGVGGDC